MSSIGIATFGMFNQSTATEGVVGGGIPYPVLTAQEAPLVIADFVGVSSFGVAPEIDYIGLKSVRQKSGSIKVTSIKRSDYGIRIKSVRVK